jgi:hypothetical protein
LGIQRSLAIFGSVQQNDVKGIQQYIFLLFHLEELLKLYVNLFYRFCVTLLFLEIFEQKNHKSASFPPSWILADMHVTS